MKNSREEFVPSRILLYQRTVYRCRSSTKYSVRTSRLRLVVGKNENGWHGRSDTADSVRSIRVQFVRSGYLYLWLRSKELELATRRNVPNLLRNLLYIFLIFPSYSLLLFVMLFSIEKKIVKNNFSMIRRNECLSILY